MKIVAMEDEIQCDADPARFEPLENAKFLSVCFCSRDFFGDVFRGRLETQLKMVETRVDKSIEFCFVERQARRDEADVESCRTRRANEFDNVRTREWFAAGEVRWQHTECGGLAKNRSPSFGVEFGSSRGPFARMGAVRTMERDAV